METIFECEAGSRYQLTIQPPIFETHIFQTAANAEHIQISQVQKHVEYQASIIAENAVGVTHGSTVRFCIETNFVS